MTDRPDARTAVHPVGAAPAAPAATLWTVQVMRGIAALMVVVGHGQGTVAGVVSSVGGQFARSRLIPWGAGVDLFFVISGFIMVHASRRLFGQDGARATFLRRRLIRIVPLYWIVTTLFVLLLAAATLKGGDVFPDARGLLSSYAFLPADTYRDGRLFPVYDLGWTLNYEMFFYALFAIVVVLPRKRAVLGLTALLAMLVLAGTALPGPSAPWFWTRPILLDFGLGMAVAALVANGTALPVFVRPPLVAAGVMLLVLDPAHVFDVPVGTTIANEWPRVLFAGVPVAAVLAGALLGGEPRMPRLALPFTRVGDASYSLYVFHPFALIVLEKLAQKVPAVARAPGWLLVWLTVATALAIAFAAWRWIERPMTAAIAALSSGRQENTHGSLAPTASPVDR